MPVFKHGNIVFGDNVAIVNDEVTRLSGHANLTGVCYGMTTPSAMHVEMIGTASEDVALRVHFASDPSLDAWFAPGLVRLVDHAVGIQATIGDQSFVKRPDGAWESIREDRSGGRRRRWFRRAT